MPEIRKIIIDTDPGQDDAVAILAGATPARTRGARHHRGGRQRAADAHREERPQDLRTGRKSRRSRSIPAPFGRWCAQLVTAENVHGKTGLNGPDLPEPNK